MVDQANFIQNPNTKPSNPATPFPHLSLFLTPPPSAPSSKETEACLEMGKTEENDALTKNKPPTEKVLPNRV